MTTFSPSFPLLYCSPLKPKLQILNRRGFPVAKYSSFGETQWDRPDREKKIEVDDFGGLGVLYDDGFGTQSVKDYIAAAKEILKPDGGPPRWFCPVECGKPINNSPLLLLLPGLDGTGMSLILHHKSLGKVFEVRCLHIPLNDRTSFQELVKFVENSIKYEDSMSRNRPIYLVGDTFGGCLALAVAARNPSIDLILVLVNPVTSYDKSKLQPVIAFLEALPCQLATTLPGIYTMIKDDHVKIAMASVLQNLFPQILSRNFFHLLPALFELTDILWKDTLLWKLYLLKSGAAYSNSRLHAVEAEVLLLTRCDLVFKSLVDNYRALSKKILLGQNQCKKNLDGIDTICRCFHVEKLFSSIIKVVQAFSWKDKLLPSRDEVWTALENCTVRFFQDSGHTLLLEDGINLLSVIKGAAMYRRSRQHDFVSDYLPPTLSEFRERVERENRFLRFATSPVMLSTLDDGRIVKGLGGVPDEGPVLLVGYHMLLALDLHFLYEEFLREKKVIVRGMAHPWSFRDVSTSQVPTVFDTWTIFGAVPVYPRNMYRLFSRKAFVLLFPGGVREALHRKGEEYKLFWPDRSEFVRMASQFGATIVPYGVVGEDDVAQVALDYNDLNNIPFVGEWIRDFNRDKVKIRGDMDGEISNQDIYFPAIMPKLPGRFYYLFGKPFKTQGRKDILKDPEMANEVYLQIRSEVEGILSYLKKKREEDPYRSILKRIAYANSGDRTFPIPTFEP